jgi:hypothetical protein
MKTAAKIPARFSISAFTNWSHGGSDGIAMTFEIRAATAYAYRQAGA